MLACRGCAGLHGCVDEVAAQGGRCERWLDPCSLMRAAYTSAGYVLTTSVNTDDNRLQEEKEIPKSGSHSCEETHVRSRGTSVVLVRSGADIVMDSLAVEF